jgi:hypothetical protein
VETLFKIVLAKIRNKFNRNIRKVKTSHQIITVEYITYGYPNKQRTRTNLGAYVLRRTHTNNRDAQIWSLIREITWRGLEPAIY